MGLSWTPWGPFGEVFSRLLGVLGSLLGAQGPSKFSFWGCARPKMALLDRFLDEVARKLAKLRRLGNIFVAMMLSEDDFR